MFRVYFLVGFFVAAFAFTLVILGFIAGMEATEDKPINLKTKRDKVPSLTGILSIGFIVFVSAVLILFVLGMVPSLGFGNPARLYSGTYNVIAVDCQSDSRDCNLLLKESGSDDVRFYQVEKADFLEIPEVGDTITVEKQHGHKYTVE